MEFIAGLVIGALLVILFKDKVLTFKFEHTYKTINEYVQVPETPEMSKILGNAKETAEDKTYKDMAGVMEAINEVIGGDM